MKYIRKEDYDNNDFEHLIEAETTAELVEKLKAEPGGIKGYGIEPCMDDRADGILYVKK